MGSLLMDGGNYDEAAKHLKGIISKHPKPPRAYKLIGTAYGMMHHEDEAIWELNRAIELDPNDAETHFNLGGVYMLKDMFDKAAKEFEKVITGVLDTTTKRLISICPNYAPKKTYLSNIAGEGI